MAKEKRAYIRSGTFMPSSPMPEAIMRAEQSDKASRNERTASSVSFRIEQSW